MRLEEGNRKSRANPEIFGNFFFISVGGTGTQAALVGCFARKTPNHTFFSSFPLAGPFSIQYNSRPVVTQKRLKRLDKTLKTFSKTFV